MAALLRRTLQPGQQIRVLIVDDSVVIRRLVSHVLEEAPDIQVAGVASNGLIALEKIKECQPDVVTLDIEMPEMNGLDALRIIRRDYPRVRVVMFSTLTDRGGAVTLEALALGADDYVAKASNAGGLDRSLASLRDELLPKIRQFFAPVQAPAKLLPAPAAVRLPVTQPSRSTATIIGIGVSTGGPSALADVLAAIPASFPVPILIVQHMPPLFTRLLSERLNTLCPLDVHEAIDGEPLDRVKILIAPGNFHMRVEFHSRGSLIRLDQSPPLNSCRPSVDALFESMALAFGPSVLGVILTGMGQDGLRGARALRSKGAHILAQDEASSVVWGMAGAVVNAGLADEILPLNLIPNAIVSHSSHAGRPYMAPARSSASEVQWPR
ncbi:chemotaxis response regulator protein-glutamate methylesterase [uncultured Paludibaculum sp.]|uniref:protein-glutamate methylesterase/protein-glutamine glutaminase n=1 Tax=uncultured Paludibaculum sp. TaxID=1765020 RepID=UPI002AAC273E|nr:chemotaxis response regulator protein-glutamate methylesterase [uncultured Paludibaculum sp.]